MSMKEPTQKIKHSYEYGKSKCGVEVYIHPIEKVYVRTPEKAEAVLQALNKLASEGKDASQ